MTRTCLYRLYDAAGRLLYVGISRSGLIRLGQHLTYQPWAEEIASSRVEWYPSRGEAAGAERAAIIAEQPRHNVIHSTRDGIRAAREHLAPPMLTPGRVIAIALYDDTTVVGLVTSSTYTDAHLDTLDWATHTFSAGTRHIRYRDIASLRFIDPLDHQTARRLGLTPAPEDVVVDIDQAADFLHGWHVPPLSDGEKEEAQRRLDTPGYRGAIVDPLPPRQARPTLITVTAVTDLVTDQNTDGHSPTGPLTCDDTPSVTAVTDIPTETHTSKTRIGAGGEFPESDPDRSLRSLPDSDDGVHHR